MAKDSLDRERNLNNVIDRLVLAEERLRRLEERLGMSADTGTGLLLVPQSDSEHLWTLVVDEMDEDWFVLVMERVR